MHRQAGFYCTVQFVQNIVEAMRVTEMLTVPSIFNVAWCEMKIA